MVCILFFEYICFMKVTPSLNRNSVKVRYSVAGKRWEIFLNITVDPDRWSVSKRQIKGEGKLTASKNQLIKEYQIEIERFVLELKRNNKTYDHEELKLHLYNRFNSEFLLKEKDGLVAHFDRYISSKKDLVKVTKVAYENTKRHLINYLDSIGSEEIQFEKVNMMFYNDFKNYLKEVCMLSPATRGKQFKNIKAVMQDALLKGLHLNISFKEFKKENEPSVNVYVTEEEIAGLRNIKDLSAAEEDLINVFAFLCYTALRFSDYEAIEPHNFYEKNGKWHLNFHQNKTSTEVDVPIMYGDAVRVLEKYSFKLPKFSNQYFNSELKAFLKKRKLFENKISVYKEKVKGAVIRREHISSHTGRRSFCTNLYLKGVPTQYIMAASGHHSVAAFKLYIKADKLEKAKGLAEWVDY